mmetsp:Transcript_14358/g.33742  ORF Transcript_14358/g.33742 Transcript_14358/m.33742 type:complete len:183 (+) Transcript_14358:76-624(+)
MVRALLVLCSAVALVFAAEGSCMTDLVAISGACGADVFSSDQPDLATLCDPGDCKTKVDAATSSCAETTGLGEMQGMVDMLAGAFADLCTDCVRKLAEVPKACQDAYDTSPSTVCGDSECKSKACEIPAACSGFTPQVAELKAELDKILATPCECDSDADASFRAGAGAALFVLAIAPFLLV